MEEQRQTGRVDTRSYLEEMRMSRLARSGGYVGAPSYFIWRFTFEKDRQGPSPIRTIHALVQQLPTLEAEQDQLGEWCGIRHRLIVRSQADADRVRKALNDWVASDPHGLSKFNEVSGWTENGCDRLHDDVPSFYVAASLPPC